MKKYRIINYVFIFVLFFIFCCPIILAATFDFENPCSSNDVKQAMQLIGFLVQIVRWIVPLFIIVLGTIDFGKASISNDENAISKALKALIRRIISGVVIFLIPPIIIVVLNVLEITKGIENEDDNTFGQCTKCIVAPYDDSKCLVIKD